MGRVSTSICSPPQLHRGLQTPDMYAHHSGDSLRNTAHFRSRTGACRSMSACCGGGATAPSAAAPPPATPFCLSPAQPVVCDVLLQFCTFVVLSNVRGVLLCTALSTERQFVTKYCIWDIAVSPMTEQLQLGMQYCRVVCAVGSASEQQLQRL